MALDDVPLAWGIIRYAPNSGGCPEDDAAAFDGWYDCREDALAVASGWATKFPQWVVALVCSDTIRFGGDFSTVRQRPLTQREREFGTGLPSTH